MEKRFNTTGLCNSKKHYLVDISRKIEKIEELIDNEFYFVITRPRQYGKTTTLSHLYKKIKDKYKVIKISFEGLGNSSFSTEEAFCSMMISMFKKQFKKDENILDMIIESNTMLGLSNIISNITEDNNIVLIIDEADKASNNEVFVEFLGMLRALYLEREDEITTTFKSVILAGVYDVKNIKFKIKGDYENRYNSPWNIAVNFNVDMSFSSIEIATMLEEYNSIKKMSLDIELLSDEIYKFTEGYPFLVSRICQIIDEDIIINEKRNWQIEDIHKAIKLLLDESNTLFDDLIKNLENNNELFEYTYSILVQGVPKLFNISNPIVNIGYMYGYLDKSKEGMVEVSNQILREYIYNYMISRANNNEMSGYNFKSNFITESNDLDMKKVLLKFQQFMKENYSSKDKVFLERHGVLLFLAFIKPIINGVGFDYKEVQISEERRLDIVISYNQHKYVIETKIWHGEVAHQKGLIQLENYLDIENLNVGYLLIFNFNKGKEYISREYEILDKLIFEVSV